MKVENIINSRGNRVANQFKITDFDNNGDVKRMSFQSYESECCRIDVNWNSKKEDYDIVVTFGRDYDYSNTTLRHLYGFLRSIPCTSCIDNRKALNQAIKDHEYKYDDMTIKVVYDENMR